MRIGICAPYDLSQPGGVATHIRAQARALRGRGHDATIFGPASAPLSDGEIALCGSVSIVFGGTASGLGLVPRASRISDLFRTTRFDVVHVHEPLTPALPWSVLRLATAPIVGTFHVHRERGHPLYPLARPMLSRLMKRLARRIAVSDAARRTVERYFPGEYDVIPNGIDLERFQRPAPRPACVDAQHRHVLVVGRLEPRKGVDHLVRAMARVQERARDVRLLAVGDGPDRESLETLARAARADVRFVGRVSDEELPAYFQWADVVCAPALGGESFGIVLLEAMASAKAIVASRIDGYERLMLSAQCGRLVPPGDPDALSIAITALLEHDGEREACSHRGADFVREYDWSHLAQRLETIYDGLLRRG
jgi:phosphatidyl-myo-inositol alpha-mannosyltransferase